MTALSITIGLAIVAGVAVTGMLLATRHDAPRPRAPVAERVVTAYCHTCREDVDPDGRCGCDALGRTRPVVDHAPTGPSDQERVRRALRELATVTQLVDAAHIDIDARLTATDEVAAHVREVAAHHQLTDAMHALGRARAALPSPEVGGDRG
ncbi:putative membrane protein affecting hemolysin expression [Lipingzhangella halophila]|uniref:Putative membrane protein affecting hemolysin expression n=1 Tax=Lipingzhangella halophila TaxID=1783352 RepID=A0A7W7RP91_9ACTN|nr:hypothetical protein [Lipingzhangella halophila]MBB4935687.1 putative membrane protein affecting hemolysin expression [Lipingzhangella halophila]